MINNNWFFKTDLSLFLILIFLFVGDTLTAILLKGSYNYSWAFKAIISILLLLNLFLSNKRLFSYFMMLFIAIGTGMVLNYLDDFISKTSLFFEYFSGILFFHFLLVNKKKKLLKKILFFIFTFYLITILLGIIFEIDFLRTYGGTRFGYMPLFSSQNEFSFVMIAIVSFFYKNLENKKSIINFVIFFLSVIISLFVGTKVIYLFIIIFINHLGIVHLKLKHYLSSLFFILTGIYILKDFLLAFLNNYFKPLISVYLNTGFLDAISSLRLSYLEGRILCQLSSLEFINYLFGGLNLNCYTEMSLIDILLFFGIIGSFFYFYLYKKIIYNSLNLDSFGYVLILAIISLSFLGGYFFENLSAQFYVLSVLFIYYHNPSSSFKNIEVKWIFYRY